MRLKEWYEKTRVKMGSNDSMCIFYEDRGKNNMLQLHTLNRLPILWEADIVRTKEYETEYMSFGLNLKQTGSGKCMSYNCWIDADEVKLAFKRKV